MSSVVSSLSAVVSTSLTWLWRPLEWTRTLVWGNGHRPLTLMGDEAVLEDREVRGPRVDWSSSYFHELRILVLGKDGSGKRSLIQQFCDKTFYPDSRHVPLGSSRLDSFIKASDLDGDVAMFLLYHQPGVGPSGLSNILYNNNEFQHDPPKGFVVTCDVTNADALTEVELWVREIKSLMEKPCILVVGTKCDQKTLRVLSYHRVLEFCKERELLYVETSARTGHNVDMSFILLAVLIKTVCQFEILESMRTNNSLNFGVEVLTMPGGLSLLQI
ncbi:ras-related protein Rab-18-B-like [Aplysia californica]|uniref:Ras-related protein Rab-18-B-like n=1 Tax=Aplysia californica TaxID=6500 RepID=A0ABM0K8B6_APLCA|nr:ras-related protein Rab-18-B-like [Aplysia californica]